MPRNLRKRGEVWWYRITKNGVTHEGSLQTGQLKLAQDRLESIRRELTATRFGEKPRRTFDDAARRFKGLFGDECRNMVTFPSNPPLEPT